MVLATSPGAETAERDRLQKRRAMRFRLAADERRQHRRVAWPDRPRSRECDRERDSIASDLLCTSAAPLLALYAARIGPRADGGHETVFRIDAAALAAAGSARRRFAASAIASSR